MNISLQRWLLVWLIVCLGAGAACTPVQTPPSTATPETRQAPTATTTAPPIPTRTRTPHPTITPRPTRTSRPTLIPVTQAAQGTQIPEHGGVIDPGNTGRLALIARWRTGYTTGIAYTPDGRYLVVASASNLFFYNTADFSLQKTWNLPYPADDIVVSPDSRMIAVANKKRVDLYRVDDMQTVLSLETAVYGVDFSPDGKTLGICNYNLIQLVEISSGNQTAEIGRGSDCYGIKFSPSGDRIAQGGPSTVIWSLDGSKIFKVGPYTSGGVTFSVSFSPDGSLIADGSDTHLHVYQTLENGRITHFREINVQGESVPKVAISPDGKKIAAMTYKEFGVWDLLTGRRILGVDWKVNFDDHSLAWSPDSKSIAIDNQLGVDVWMVDGSDKASVTLASSMGTLDSIAYSPNCEHLAIGAQEGVTYILDPQTGKISASLPGMFGTGMAFSPDSTLLAVGDGLGLQVFTSDGSPAASLAGFSAGYTQARFLPDGQHLIANLVQNPDSAFEVGEWNTSDWTLDRTIRSAEPMESVTTGFDVAPALGLGALSYHTIDGQQSGFIQVFKLSDGSTTITLEPPAPLTQRRITRISFSPDNALLLAYMTEGWDHHLVVWNTADWSIRYDRKIGILQSISWVTHQAIAWSPDGRLLAVPSGAGSVKILDAASGDTLTILVDQVTDHYEYRGYANQLPISDLAFSPDGRLLTAVSQDGIILFWGLR